MALPWRTNQNLRLGDIDDGRQTFMLIELKSKKRLKMKKMHGTLCTIDSTSRISRKPEHKIQPSSMHRRQNHTFFTCSSQGFTGIIEWPVQSRSSGSGIWDWENIVLESCPLTCSHIFSWIIWRKNSQACLLQIFGFINHLLHHVHKYCWDQNASSSTEGNSCI